MKKLLFFALVLTSMLTFAQTAAEKPEFIKFMNYCQFPIERTFYMYGEVSVVKYNPDYTNDTLRYAQINGDWMAKHPLVIKWYPIDSKTVRVTEAYQHEIVAQIKVMVPRVYCTSKSEYLTLFRAHWKNGDIQSGWMDSHFIGVWDFTR